MHTQLTQLTYRSTFSTFSLHSLYILYIPDAPYIPCVLGAFFYCRPLACTWLLSSSVQVDLSDNRLSPSTIGRVLLALRESGQGKGLLTLNLSRNVLGVEGARALVTLCEDGSAPVLRELRLDHMEIRDQVSTC